jgi:hypothetical protein
VEFFWKKYVEPAAKPDNKYNLCIVNYKVPCAVGLEVTREIDCPLSSDEYLDNSVKYVDMLGRVIRFRVENPDGQYLEYSAIDPERAQRTLSDLFKYIPNQ